MGNEGVILVALRVIFGAKQEEVIGGWRRLYSEVLLNLYCLPDATVWVI
jgi:hypothetical protein